MKRVVVKVEIEVLVEGKEVAEQDLAEGAAKAEAAWMNREARKGSGGRAIHGS